MTASLGCKGLHGFHVSDQRVLIMHHFGVSQVVDEVTSARMGQPQPRLQVLDLLSPPHDLCDMS